MNELLKEVKKDYNKRGNKNYDNLYKLYELLPLNFEDKLKYEDKLDGLWFDGNFLGDLSDLEIIREDDCETFDIEVRFTRNDEKEFRFLTFKHTKCENGKWGHSTYILGDWDNI